MIALIITITITIIMTTAIISSDIKSPKNSEILLLME